MAETEAPSLPSVATDIDKMDAIRETKSGKAKPSEKQDLDLGKGEDIPKPDDVVEKSADKPVETPADKTESKPEPAENVKPKKPKFWKKETPTPPANGEIKPSDNGKPTPPNEPPAPAEFKLPKEIQERLEKAEALLNKPSVKMVLKAESSGKDFTSFYEELKAKDPFKMSYEDIYKIQLDKDGYAPAEKERKLAKFLEKDEDDQADIITHTRKELKTAFDKEIQDFTPTFESEPNPHEMVWSTLEKAVPEVGKEYIGKELHGIVVTPERYNSVIDLTKPIVKKGADGNPDPEDFFKVKFLVENIEAIMDIIAETNWLKATDKLEEEITLPLSSESGNHTPQPRQLITEDQKRIKDLADSLPK